MADALLRDLPSFLERVGTDAQCRAYLVEARWPDGFRCADGGHDRDWTHHRRVIEACRACGKQHSILEGTLFERTKTGPARWFLAIYRVTSSKGGISALELQRQMGFRSDGTLLRALAARGSSRNRIARLLTIDGPGCTRSAAPRAPPTTSPGCFNRPSASRPRRTGRSLQPTLLRALESQLLFISNSAPRSGVNLNITRPRNDR